MINNKFGLMAGLKLKRAGSIEFSEEITNIISLLERLSTAYTTAYNTLDFSDAVVSDMTEILKEVNVDIRHLATYLKKFTDSAPTINNTLVKRIIDKLKTKDAIIGYGVALLTDVNWHNAAMKLNKAGLKSLGLSAGWLGQIKNVSDKDIALKLDWDLAGSSRFGDQIRYFLTALYKEAGYSEIVKQLPSIFK